MPDTVKKKIKLLTVPSKHNSTQKSSPNKEKLKKNSPSKSQHTDLSMSHQGKSYNDEFIGLLNEFANYMNIKGEPFRAKAYEKAEFEIIKYPENIYSIDQIKKLPGIGSTILSKLDEYIKTGKIAALEKERNDPVNIIAQVYGIGPQKSKELVKKGITSIEQLRENTDLLNDKQKIGLKYYEDILQKIPRDEIIDFEKKFRNIFKKVAPPGSTFEIVGSFRRQANQSGDIDIIITNKDNDRTVFDKVIDTLVKDKILTELLSKGKIKSHALIQIDKDAPIRRVDFLYSPPSEYAFALLYFTGSKIFNTLVRQRALQLGFTLNEHGLSYMTKGVKGVKVDQDFPTEQSILNFLGVEYIEPKYRTNHKSMKLMQSETPDKKEKIDIDEKHIQDIEQEEEDIDFTEEELMKALEDVESEDEKTKSPKTSKGKNKTLKKPVKLFPQEAKIIESFRKDGISFIKTLTEKQLSDLINYANNKYYCEDNPVLTDSEYDIIREYTLEKFPDNEAAKSGHTKCVIEVSKHKVELPYELWSMDKIKPDTKAIDKWIKKYKGPYVLSGKLDGISALYTSGKIEEEARFYTRGNGIVGQDISHLIPYIIWKNKPIHSFELEFAIRGEIIIKKSVFNKKYSDKFANPRNFVAGIVNKKTIDIDILMDLDFVPYEVINPILKPSEQLKFITDRWISKPVKYVVKEKISNDVLSKVLLDWRESYEYEIDGIICTDDNIYKRPKGNPEYAFAFKMVISDQVAEAKVIDVIWTPSKDGYLKPRIQIEPVNLGGVKIEYATGFNARFIEDNKIGIGAIITIIRSGEVIPHILNVITPAEIVKVPSVPYKWNESKVDFILDDKETSEVVRDKNIALFLKTLKVEGIAIGNVKKLVEAGFDTIPKILAMSKSDFLKVDGFKEKTADKLYNGIKSKIDEASLSEIMAASNIFGRGFGEKSLKNILKRYPDILTIKRSDKEKEAMLLEVDGIASRMANKFVTHIPDFLEFIKQAKLEDKLEIVKESKMEDDLDKSHPLYGKKIVLTGFRDKTLLETLKNIGAENSASVSKNTFVVVVKDDKDETTGKADAARKLNIPIMTLDEFKDKYIKN
jgi:NAD-dependent DNA ligase